MQDKVEMIDNNEMGDIVELLSENEAIAFLKTLQGAKTVTVPLVVNGCQVHKGICFNVSLTDYNNFINAQQGAKASLTSSAKEFLTRTVQKEHSTILLEALKIPGVIDFVMGEVIPQVAPEVKSTLD